MNLKDYEWAQMGWEKAENPVRRVLLIGDSITGGYWDTVRGMAEDGMCVDKYITSKAINDPTYLRELEYFLSYGFKYDVVHFNNGLHGGGTSTEYAAHYEGILKYILNATNAKVVLALSTPTREISSAEYTESNNAVIEYNEAVCRIAEKYGSAVNDLYTTADGLSEFCTDGIHYTQEGYQILGEQVFGFIKGAV